MRQGLLRENVRLGKMAVTFSFTSAVSQPFKNGKLISWKTNSNISVIWCEECVTLWPYWSEYLLNKAEINVGVTAVQKWPSKQ